MKRTLVISFSALVVTLLLVVVTSLIEEPIVNGNKSHISLKPPLFIQPAYAQGTPEVGAKLDSEAGISAYTHSADLIDLNLVRPVFTTIEIETADYIIGSVPIPNYIEHYDAHVYVHKNGWILAYYGNADPVAKIIDVRGQTIATTKLESAVAAVASAAAIIYTGVTYYDFRYPNATNLLFVAEHIDNGNDFTITLPSSYGYSEFSWGLHKASTGTNPSITYFTIDGTELPADYFEEFSDASGYGTITPSQLLPNMPHIITVDDYGVLVIVYRVS